MVRVWVCFLCFLLLSGILAAEPRIEFSANQVVTLVGKVHQEKCYGPPNYGENPSADSVEFYFFIDPAPGTVFIDAEMRKEYAPKSIQVISCPDFLKDYMSLGNSLGKDISISGFLFKAASGHHHSELLLSLDVDIRGKMEKANHAYWPDDGEGLAIFYLGICNGYRIYKTELVWGAAGRMTHRLVFLDRKNDYLGHYYGIQSRRVEITGKKIVFPEFIVRNGNSIDMTLGPPGNVWIDGEVHSLRK